MFHSWPRWVEEIQKAVSNDVRVPRKAAAHLALDIVLVGAQCRTATLVDVVVLSLRSAIALTKLCKAHQLDIAVVLFAPAQQAWIIHRERFFACWDNRLCTYVDPRQPNNVSTVMPNNARTILTCVHEACHQDEPCMIVCDTNASARMAGIAACGWLLDYPVVYSFRTALPTVRLLSLHTLEAAAYWDADVWDTEPVALTDMSLFLTRATISCASLQFDHTMLAYTEPTDTPDAHTRISSASERMEMHWRARRAHLPDMLGNVSFHISTTLVHMDRIIL